MENIKETNEEVKVEEIENGEIENEAGVETKKENENTGTEKAFDLNKFLESEDGRKALQPKMDQYFAKGLETWKQNNLQKLIDGEINKRFPAETEEQKQIRDLQQKLEQIENEKTYAMLKTEAMTALSSQGITTEIADFFIAGTKEETLSKIQNFTEIFKKEVNKEVEERIKKAGISPTNTPKQEIDITKEEILKMDYNTRVAFYNNNPEIYAKLMGN